MKKAMTVTLDKNSEMRLLHLLKSNDIARPMTIISRLLKIAYQFDKEHGELPWKMAISGMTKNEEKKAFIDAMYAKSAVRSIDSERPTFYHQATSAQIKAWTREEKRRQKAAQPPRQHVA